MATISSIGSGTVSTSFGESWESSSEEGRPVTSPGMKEAYSRWLRGEERKAHIVFLQAKEDGTEEEKVESLRQSWLRQQKYVILATSEGPDSGEGNL